MKNISIRPFTLNEWQAYRTIRLEALSSHPNYFSPSRDETKFTEIDWKERLGNPNGCTFGLFDNDEVIGITGVVRDHTEFEKGHLVSSYIKPAYRKKGLSRLLYEARIQWAREHETIKYLVVDHNEENEPSMRAHQNFGFKFFGSYDETLHDGKIKKILSYKMEV